MEKEMADEVEMAEEKTEKGKAQEKAKKNFRQQVVILE